MVRLQEQRVTDCKAGCMVNMALLHHRQGDYTEAFTWCDRALKCALPVAVACRCLHGLPVLGVMLGQVQWRLAANDQLCLDSNYCFVQDYMLGMLCWPHHTASRHEHLVALLHQSNSNSSGFKIFAAIKLPLQCCLLSIMRLAKALLAAGSNRTIPRPCTGAP